MRTLFALLLSIALAVQPLPLWDYSVDCPLDHLNDRLGNHGNFPLKYAVYNKFWDVQKGPIFLVVGGLPEKTGTQYSQWIYETLAQEHKALVVYGSHRFDGISQPEAGLTKDMAKFVTVEQVLQDNLFLIRHVKHERVAERSPVIVFGTGYSGMLATWLRLKHSQFVQGAVVASMPIRYFKGMTSPYSYSRAITGMFLMANRQCP